MNCVEEFSQKVSNDPLLADGFDLICLSQGNILCRGYVEIVNSPKVHKFIMIAGPNGGYYCGNLSLCPDPIDSIPFLDQLIDEVVYTDLVQEMLSPANYWRSPY